MTETDVLGFNPQDLEIFKEKETTTIKDSKFYRMRPKESKSEDGVYRAKIKVIYNPFDVKNSVIEQVSYGLQDANGWFTVVSALTNNDTNCPIFKAWKKCHYAEEGSELWKQAATDETKGGRALFDRRYARYCVVQILEDKNQPDLQYKYMFWKLPKSIWDDITAETRPSAESGRAAIPVMDFLFGRALDIEVTPGPKDALHPERETREIKYRCKISQKPVSCVNPDGSPLLNDADSAVLKNYVNDMRDVWESEDADERKRMMDKINADPNTAELRKIYAKVMEDLKGFVPNLEELGFKEWTPEVANRVQNWINVVLACNNPATVALTPEAAAEQVEANQESNAEALAAAPASNPDDDLPF